MGATRITTDHDEIRTWVEERGGAPAHVRHTSHPETGLGVLRIDFPGIDAEETLEALNWEDWFRAFDEHRLAFLHEDEGGAEGGECPFNKIVSRDAIGSAEREAERRREDDDERLLRGHTFHARRPAARRLRA